MGDIAEVKAVRSVFSDWSNIKMNATKSMIGHCLGAAAGVEAIATIMAIKRGEVHPTINHKVWCHGLLRVPFPAGLPNASTQRMEYPSPTMLDGFQHAESD